MIKKKILIVSRSFYPTNSPRAIRTTELVKELTRQGHEVTLITSKKPQYHLEFEEKFRVTIKDMGEVKFRDIDTKKGKKGWVLIKRAVRRGMLMLFDFPNIEFMFKTKKALKYEQGYDLLISVAVPHSTHWGVAWARSKSDKISQIWVADCGDPYAGAENDTFKVWPHFKWLEKWFCRKADYISVPFEGAKKAYFQEFRSKIKVIPQGFSVPEVDENENNEVTEPLVPVFAYVGNVTSYLHYALPFLNLLNETKMDFKFIVYTKRKDIFESNLNDGALSKCDIRGYTDRKKLFEELAGVDFFIHFPYQNSTQRSLKLIDYAFIGKPILSFIDDQKSRNAFTEFLQGNYRFQLIVENLNQFRIENVTHQFLELCNR